MSYAPTMHLYWDTLMSKQKCLLACSSTTRWRNNYNALQNEWLCFIAINSLSFATINHSGLFCTLTHTDAGAGAPTRAGNGTVAGRGTGTSTGTGTPTVTGILTQGRTGATTFHWTGLRAITEMRTGAHASTRTAAPAAARPLQSYYALAHNVLPQPSWARDVWTYINMS